MEIVNSKFNLSNIASRANLIIFLHIAALFASTISNYNWVYFSIKTFLAASVLILVIIRKKEVNKVIQTDKFFTILLTLISIYPLISILYSKNFEYGLIKLFHYYIGTIWSIINTFLIVRIISIEELLKGLRDLLFLSAPLVLLIIITTPFEYGTAYKFEINRLSHVFTGRYLSYGTMILFFFFLQNKEKIYLILFSLFFVGLITSGFRAGILGSVILITSYTIYKFYKGELKLNKNHLISVFVIGVVSVISVILFNMAVIERLLNIIGVFNSSFETGGAIAIRFDAYRLAWEIFIENPLFGAGLGSFNYEWFGSLTGTYIKYPHNLFLEILAELGIIGLLIFGYVIGFMVVKSLRESKELFFIILLGLFLAQFSKDLGTNGLLFGLAGSLFKVQGTKFKSIG
ncbi:MAG: O-antigen ligase family protein [Melioribacteraceae bacterium]|nr:O-antigen ligase family protein [Melioribacteraceae bacterium]